MNAKNAKFFAFSLELSALSISLKDDIQLITLNSYEIFEVTFKWLHRADREF